MPPPTITYNDFSKLSNKIEMLEKTINLLKEKEIYDLKKKLEENKKEIEGNEKYITESLKDNDEYWGEKFNNLYHTIERTRSSVTFLFDLIDEKLHPGAVENFTEQLENLEAEPVEPIEPIDENAGSEVSSLEGGVKKRRKSRKNKKKLNIRSRKKRRH